jgi:glucuronoarabinoxylan endo-1,4-beta-xylanase
MLELKQKAVCTSMVKVFVAVMICMTVSLVQAGSLQIDFGTSSSSIESGYQAYRASNEQPATFTTQSYDAFGTTVSITPSWASGADATAMQMINRTNLNGYADGTEGLMSDWIGTDTRSVGDPMTLTISGLPAGDYSWVSYHHDVDAANTHFFDVTVNDAAGSATTTGVQITNTPGDSITTIGGVSKFETALVSDGSDITLVFDQQPWTLEYNDAWFIMNGFVVQTAAPGPDEASSPNPASGANGVPVDTSLSWDAPTAYTPTQYDVYFGASPDAHSNPKYTVTTNTYDPPGELAAGTTYYWAVDSYDSGTVYPGNDWYFTSLFQANDCIVDGQVRHQIIDGFGFSDGWSGTFSSAKNDALYDTLGMTILRAFKLHPDFDGGYNTPAANLTAAQAHGAQVLCTYWPPEEWELSNNHLDPIYYQSYADWIENNVTDVDIVSPFNEPDFANAIEMTGEEIREFIKNHCASLSSTRPILIAETVNFNDAWTDPTLNDPAACDKITYIGGHFYGGGNYVHSNALSKGKPVWQTEYAFDNSKFMDAAKTISDALNNNFSAYCWWWVRNGDVPDSLADNNGTIYTNGYILGQFGKWVRPGKQRIGTNYNDTGGVYITAYDNDGVVIVAINANTYPVDQNFVLQGLGGVESFIAYRTSSSQSMDNVGQKSVTNSMFSDQLPAQSVTTYVQTTTLEALSGNGQISLDWTDSGHPDFAGYTVYRSTTSGSGYTPIATGVTVSDYIDSTVNNGTTYFYIVAVVDSGNNEVEYSNEVSATPSDPAAPIALTATAGEDSIRLDWADNIEPDLAGYNVKCAAVSGGPYITIASNVTTSEYTHNDAINGVTFYYVVTAVNTSLSESQNSNEVSATLFSRFLESGGILSMEAENGNKGSRWSIGTASGASNGEYIEVYPEYNWTGSAPQCTIPECIVSYDFNISTGGNYRFWFRTQSYDANDDSFFWRIDSGSWVYENGRSGIGSWFSRDNSQMDNLIAGNHTLEIAYRENGTRLDKFVIQLDSLTDPSGDGPAESSVTIGNEVTTCQQVQILGYRLNGDLNGDCQIGMSDLILLADQWLSNNPAAVSPDYSPDIIVDNEINLADFAAIADQWLVCNDPEVAGCIMNW